MGIIDWLFGNAAATPKSDLARFKARLAGKSEQEAGGLSGRKLLTAMKKAGDEQRVRFDKAVESALAHPRVRELLTTRDIPPSALKSLCSTLRCHVPDEKKIFKAIRNVEMLDWLFSLPGLCVEPDVRFPDERSLVEFCVWVRYGTRPDYDPRNSAG